MPGQEQEVYRSITARRAEILSRVVDQRTETEIADDLAISKHTVESHINWLKAKANVRSKPDLGRWWMANRETWLEYLANLAGIPSALTR